MSVKTYITSGVAAMINNDRKFNIFVSDSIKRHLSGDYGNTCAEDAELNKNNTMDSLSAYTYKENIKIWIKQENNIIIVLFPNEY